MTRKERMAKHNKVLEKIYNDSNKPKEAAIPNVTDGNFVSPSSEFFITNIGGHKSYQLGAKGFGRNETDENKMDCSGGVCRYQGRSQYESLMTGAINIYDEAPGESIKKETLKDGDYMYIPPKDGKEPHIAIVNIDSDGNKWITEQRGSTGTTVTPFDERVKELEDAGRTMSYKRDSGDAFHLAQRQALGVELSDIQKEQLSGTTNPFEGRSSSIFIEDGTKQDSLDLLTDAGLTSEEAGEEYSKQKEVIKTEVEGSAEDLLSKIPTPTTPTTKQDNTKTAKAQEPEANKLKWLLPEVPEGTLRAEKEINDFSIFREPSMMEAKAVEEEENIINTEERSGIAQYLEQPEMPADNTNRAGQPVEGAMEAQVLKFNKLKSKGASSIPQDKAEPDLNLRTSGVPSTTFGIASNRLPAEEDLEEPYTPSIGKNRTMGQYMTGQAGNQWGMQDADVDVFPELDGDAGSGTGIAAKNEFGIADAGLDAAHTPPDTDEFSTADGMGNMAGAGNMIGSVSSIGASLGQLTMALANRPKPEVNTFADYATDALVKLQETKQFAGKIRDMQMQDLAMAERGQRLRNRGSARGINTMRALDMGTHLGGIGAQRGINIDYYNRLEGIYGKEAGMLLGRDQAIMSGEERKNERTLMNRDNYRSGISQAIAGMGEAGQNVGANINRTAETEMSMNIAGNMGKYGDADEYRDFLLWKQNKRGT